MPEPMTIEQLIRTAGEPIEVPSGLEGRMLDRLRAERGPKPVAHAPRRRRLWVPAAIAGSLAAAAAAVVIATSGGTTEPPLELSAQLVGPNGQAASAEVTETGIGRVIAFDTRDLPILPTGQLYELWFVGPGDAPGTPNRISAGTFHPDPEGRSEVTFAAAVDPRKYPTLVVTAEAGDGNPAPGKEVLRSR